MDSIEDHVAQGGSPDTFFFQQTTFRQTPRRFKKQPEELPQDLRFAHLNPRVAAYLQSKEKEKDDGVEDNQFARKSLLPQISETFNLVRQQLNAALSNDEDSQRFMFQEIRANAPGILVPLAKLLSLARNVARHYKVNVPGSLEGVLLSNYGELTQDVQVVPREWQLSSNREEYLQKMMREDNMGRCDESKDGTTPMGSCASLGGTGSRAGDRDDDIRSVRSVKSNRSAKGEVEPPKTSKSQTRQAKREASRVTNLTDIIEQEEAQLTRPLSRGDALKSREKVVTVQAPGAQARPRTRLEKFRPSTTSVDAPKCWIVHPTHGKDPERETLYEWATQRLQPFIKQRTEEDEERREKGDDKPVVLRYYGDSRREVMLKYGRLRPSGPRSGNALTKTNIPRVPPFPAADSQGRSVFMTAISDGSVTLYYPSGNVAALSSSAGPGRPGFYTVVYDDIPDHRMLAVFTPTGKGCCYHENGNIQFLSSEKGGTMADELGGITKRWSWPPHQAKLSASIILELSPCVTFRCVNHTNMYIYFSCQGEEQKVNVGMCPGAEDMKPKDDNNQLVTGFPFCSQAAKEASRPPKPKPVQIKDKKLKSGKKDKKANPQPPEIQKLLEMPEHQQLENDVDADKELIKLQRKVKNLVEDWLEHYRIAIGITSPLLKSVKEGPVHRVRLSQSAKSSPAGNHVIIESMATQCVRPTIEPRAPSAPPGRFMDRPISSCGSSRESRPASVAKDVKFNEVPPEEEEEEGDDAVSVQHSTRNPSGASGCSSRPGSRHGRAKSAPNRISLARTSHVVGTPLGGCPIALRQLMLGEEHVACKCTRHKIPNITDIEYDDFINVHAPPEQLIVVAVCSSLYPSALTCTSMLEQLYSERNRNRTRPCLQARGDPYRVFFYDTAAASDFTDHATPLLLRRHNVVPGMFLMYEDGKLLFCDHIFNGYGNARKDFHKQMMETRRSASSGRSLPADFRFSPIRGRHGPRSPWGGQIGGAGVDRYGNAGVAMGARYVRKGPSCTSLTSNDSSHQDFVGGGASIAKYISMSLTVNNGFHGSPETDSFPSSTDIQFTIHTPTTLTSHRTMTSQRRAVSALAGPSVNGTTIPV